MTLDQITNKVSTASVLWSTAEASVRTAEKNVKEAEEELAHVEEAQAIVQTVAQGIQQQIHNRIAGVVSRCLHSVFDEPYDSQIAFEQKRGRTEARLSFVRDGIEVDPLTASGGGVVDVAAFALRLSALMLQRPPVRRLLVLDEPFKHLSKNYAVRIRSTLLQLAEEMGVQIVMVTHNPLLRCGKVVKLDEDYE